MLKQKYSEFKKKKYFIKTIQNVGQQRKINVVEKLIKGNDKDYIDIFRLSKKFLKDSKFFQSIDVIFQFQQYDTQDTNQLGDQDKLIILQLLESFQQDKSINFKFLPSMLFIQQSEYHLDIKILHAILNFQKSRELDKELFIKFQQLIKSYVFQFWDIYFWIDTVQVLLKFYQMGYKTKNFQNLIDFIKEEILLTQSQLQIKQDLIAIVYLLNKECLNDIRIIKDIIPTINNDQLIVHIIQKQILLQKDWQELSHQIKELFQEDFIKYLKEVVLESEDLSVEDMEIVEEFFEQHKIDND